jgi:hypothetical protein
MRSYEVFNPVNGVALWTVPFAWIARLIAHTSPYLDWAPAGDGWTS